MRQINFYITLLLALLFSHIALGQVKEYFITCDPEEFAYIYEHFEENIYIPITLTYENYTWTDTEMRIRGDGSRYLPKKSLKVRFNGEPFANDREKLNFNAEYEDKSYIRAFLSSRVFRLAGQDCFNADFARLYLNGEFFGLYLRIENMDEQFLEARDYDPDGNLYKATKDGACLSIYDDIVNFWEKKTGNGPKDDLAELIHQINYVSDEEYAEFCQNTLDYDAMVNIIACNMILSNQSTYYHNYYMYHDVNGDDKWRMFPWDIDKTFSVYGWKNYTNSSVPWAPDNPFLERAILCPSVFNDIKTRVNEIFGEVFIPENLVTEIDSLVTVLYASVLQDTTDDIENTEIWLDQVNTEKNYIQNWQGQLNWQFENLHHSFIVDKTPGVHNPDVCFQWNPSTDPNGEQIEYAFHITTGWKFEPELTIIYTGITDTFFIINNIAEEDYFWKVVAIKGNHEVEGFDSKNPLKIKIPQILPCIIEQNMILSPENSPYIVDCDIQILPDVKLTIQSGVEIIFIDSCSVRVYGEIVSEGTEENPVVIRPGNELPFWDSISMINTTGTCKFSYTHFINGRLNGYHSDIVLNHISQSNTKHLQWHNGLFTTFGGNIEVKNSRFESNNSGEGLIFSTPQSADVQDCYFFQIPDAVEYLHHNGGVIKNNVIINPIDDGIDLDYVHDALIEGNIIFNAFDNGITLDSCMDVTIKGNLIVGCSQGINLKNNAHALLISNTLEQNNRSIWLYEKYAGSGGGHATILNTIFSNSVDIVIDADSLSSYTVGYSICNNETLPGIGNLIGDPLFKSPPDTNFTLLPASPCINAGDPESPNDPDGTRADMGAYYFNLAEHDIIINEINYNSAPDFDPEDWVELFNNEDFAADISGWIFKDEKESHIFEIPYGTTIEAGGYLVLCKDAAAFSQMFPETGNFVGSFGFGLSSSGELTRLYNANNVLIDSVVYGVSTPWPELPNGNGPTLELKNPSLDNTLGKNWASSLNHGTPGKINSGFIPNVNELSDSQFVINIFPNPSNGQFSVHFYNDENCHLKVRLFDICGKFISELWEDNSKSNDHVFRTDSYLEAGIYFLAFSITFENSTIKLTKKVIILE